MDEQKAQIRHIKAQGPNLIDSKEGLFQRIQRVAKAQADERAADSNQSQFSGIRPHLINKKVARAMRDFNPYHAACIDAKVNSSVGQGHRDERIHEVLDPLCEHSWQDVLDAVGQDLVEGGDGLIEVVRESDAEGAPIVGLYHLDASEVELRVEVEDEGHDFHYSRHGVTEQIGGKSVVMARFGDLPDLKDRFGEDRQRRQGRPRDRSSDRNARQMSSLDGKIVNSEVIHFRLPTNRSRYWGLPDYLSATPAIELMQCMTQEKFDFYYNRGVPEFMLFLLGRNMNPEDFDKIVATLRANQGPGNAHRTNAFHIPGDPADMSIQVEKLAVEGRGDAQFRNDNETLALNIVAAHGVPALLANIPLPGKMASQNEGPNALLLFQKQKLNRIQRLVSMQLACTLGSDGVQLQGPSMELETLSRDQFLGKGQGPTDSEGMPQHVSPGNGFRTVLDGMSLGAMQTLATMREPLAGSQRDLEAGPLSSQDDRPAGDPRGR